MPVEYLKQPQVAALINNGSTYQKSAQTALRKPRAEEIGTPFSTYVKHGDGIRKESDSTITADVVIARNLGSIGTNSNGQEVFNEWSIPMATAVKNYGQDVVDSLSTTEFTNHKKKALLKGIELTPEVMNMLGISGDTLEIKVSWSEEPMVAKLGDVITDGGYSVSQHDMKDYEQVK